MKKNAKPTGPASSTADAGDDGGIGPSHVVGIGASAGGLEALEQFFSTIPAVTGLAFVVIQHLSPDYKSLMVQLLAKHASIRIRPAEDGQRIDADTAYVIPPGKDITVEDSTLTVANQPARRGASLPVDKFFRSLAKDYGERAIAVVLSGTGSDGARGVRAVKEAGGMVVVQSPPSAKFDGMPKSAELTGVADFVLEPHEMGPQLVSYIGQMRMAADGQADELVSDEQTRIRLFARIRERHNVDFTYYRMSTILRRIQRRISITRAGTMGEYLRLLEHDRAEVDALYRELLIGVTSFFRDPPAFEALRGYWLERLRREDPPAEIRAWVAGCSTGEEAYSVAITLLEAIRECGLETTVKLFATDIDTGALSRAAAGRYPESIAADVDSELLSRYFVHKDQDYQVGRSVRERIVFAQHNLVRDPPFTNIDLVCCRNLLIYMQNVLQRRVLEHLNFALSDGGVLFLGSSETVGDMLDSYEPLNHKWKIYRSRGGRRVPTPMREVLYPDVRHSRIHLPPGELTPKASSDEGTLSRFMDALGSEYLPLTLIVDESTQLVHLIGEPGDYLRIPTGRTTVSVTHLIVRDLSMPLSTGLQKVFSGESDVQYTNVRVHFADEVRRCDVRIRRLPDQRRAPPLAAVMIKAQNDESTDAAGAESVVFDVEGEQSRLIEDLQQELQFTRENLQATIEELETANEELQATNEELMASNEELQSTNEELQSVNEELHSVNAEHQEKIMELTELNNDLENLFDNTDAAMLFLDENLMLRRMNERMQALIGEDHDVRDGRFRADYLGIADTDIDRRIEEANTCDTPWDGEVRRLGGGDYLVRIRPYRLAPAVFAGVTLTLVDITSLLDIQRALSESRERYRALVEQLNDGVVLYRLDGPNVLVEEVNEAARRMGSLGEQVDPGTPILDVWPNVEEFGIVKAVRRVNKTGKEVTLPKAEYTDAKVVVWVRSRFYRVAKDSVVGVFTDATRESRLEAALESRGISPDEVVDG